MRTLRTIGAVSVTASTIAPISPRLYPPGKVRLFVGSCLLWLACVVLDCDLTIRE